MDSDGRPDEVGTVLSNTETDRVEQTCRGFHMRIDGFEAADKQETYSLPVITSLIDN